MINVDVDTQVQTLKKITIYAENIVECLLYMKQINILVTYSLTLQNLYVWMYNMSHLADN